MMTFDDDLYALVVDDNVDCASLTVDQLEANSDFIEADYVTSGSDALDYLDSGSVNAVVADYRMPGMDGLELLEHVNSDFDIPFIMYTGAGDEKTAVEAMRKGAEDYVTKSGHESAEVLANRVENASMKHKVLNELSVFKAGVESAGHGVEVTDAEGNLIYVNPAVEEITGYSEEELIGENPSMLASGHHSEEFYDDLWTTVLNGEIWEGEMMNETKDGEAYLIDQTIAPITDSNGDLKYMMAINTDITEQREESNRKALLNSMLRHDLANEQQSAVAYVQMLQETELTDEQQRYVDHLDTSIENSVELLKGVRGLLSDDPGGAREEVEVEDLVDSVLEDKKRMAQRKNIDIGVEVEEDYSVEAGPLLEQAVGNLVENAIVHPDDVSEINVEVMMKDGGVDLTVADDGEGLPDDFSWEKGAKGEDSDGTGVGTWIVKEVAEVYGDGVEAGESDLGGAEFSMTLDPA